MAQQGYWVVCEDLYAESDTQREPAMYMGCVEGFSYAHVMGGSRMEVLARVRRKLQDNINFLLACYNDVPQPSYSDSPPEGNNVTNTAYIFLGLKEMKMTPEMLEPLAA